ncbi:MAG TPA: hypothetical protein VF060_06635 [Trebonia sp.]
MPVGEGVLDRSRLRAHGGGQVGCGGGAHGVQQVIRVDAGLGAAARGGAGQRAAEVADLDAGQRRVGLRSCYRDQGIDRGGGEVGHERALALGGHRLVWVHVQLAERGGWEGREGVEFRAETAQRLGQFGAGARVAEVGGLDHGESPAAQRFGELRQRRQPHQMADGGDLVRHCGGPFTPGVQHLRGTLDREEQVPRVQVADRVQTHLQRGHHAHAAAAAHGPEQVRIMVGVSADQVAVRGDQLGRGDAVGGQPVAAGQPAEPAAEGVPGHAHRRGGARQRGQAVPGGRDGHVRPHRAGPRAGGAARWVDVHCAHACRPQQHRAVQRFERSGAVACALRGDPDPAGAGVADRLGHVGGRPGLHDDGGPLVHG